MSPIITIIVPVYNTEKYLPNCINSILSQSFKDWEMILIDDGSTDKSPIICDDFASKDKRIKIIHQANAGVSAARNKALENAFGKWIYFCDSDDVLAKKDSLKELYELSANAELAVAGLQEIDKNGRDETHFWPKMKFNGSMSKEQYISCVIDGGKIGYQGFLVTKLFNKEIISKNNIKFDKDIKYGEDILFITRYCCCNEVKNINIDNTNCIYKYMHREGGAMTSLNNSYNQNIFTDFIAFEEINNLIINSFKDPQLRAASARKLVDAGNCHLELIQKCDKNAFKNQRDYISHVMEQYPKLKEENDTLRSFRRMKIRAKEMPFANYIKYIRQWLLSKHCHPEYLKLKWRLYYKTAKLTTLHQ